jgi:hypothetical protein
LTSPQSYECKESEHVWVRGRIAIVVPEESAKVRHFENERCTKCGAIRRACYPNGDPIPEIEADA